MKEIKIEKVIPEHIETETWFECEHCLYKTTDKYSADQHSLKNHHCLKMIYVGGLPLYWFETKEKSEYWFKRVHPKENLFRYDTNSFYVYWTGPGWYIVDKKYELRDIGWYLSSQQYLLEKIKNSIMVIEAAIS